MMLTLIAAALLVPPPPEGDDRAAILYTVNALVDALTSSDSGRVDALLESEGSFVRVDVRDPSAIKTTATSFADIRRDSTAGGSRMTEKLGIPTLVQRGPLAQVWMPYSFAIDGKLSHCGIDAFTLVQRGDHWRVSGLAYTVEAPGNCAALAAPAVD